MQPKNETRTCSLITLIAALLGGSAALALDAPPIIRGDEHHDIRYPFTWGMSGQAVNNKV